MPLVPPHTSSPTSSAVSTTGPWRSSDWPCEFPSLEHTIVIGEPTPGQVGLDLTPCQRRNPITFTDRLTGTAICRRSVHDAAVGGHHLAVEARPAHPQRLRPETRGCVRELRDSTPTPCSWPCSRWATTTTWHLQGCWGRWTPGAPSSSGRAVPRGDVFAECIERERVTVMRSAVPLITNWLNSEAARVVRSLLAEGRPERRSATAAGAACARPAGAELHPAGDLRHRRGPHQHDTAR